jgi:hypothetical protein
LPLALPSRRFFATSPPVLKLTAGILALAMLGEIKILA